MFVVCVVYFQVEISAMSLSLVQRSPTCRGASFVIKEPRETFLPMFQIPMSFSCCRDIDLA
jgi:hypothetical protein